MGGSDRIIHSYREFSEVYLTPDLRAALDAMREGQDPLTARPPHPRKGQHPAQGPTPG